MDLSHDESVQSIYPKFIDMMNQYLVNNKTILEDTTNIDSLINIKEFEARENLILQLTNALGALPDLISRLETALSTAKSIHAKEFSAVDALVNKRKKDDDSEAWTTVVRRKQESRNPSRNNYNNYVNSLGNLNSVSSAHNITNLGNLNAPIITTLNNPPAVLTNKYSKVKFTEALSISAIRVPTFDYVKQDGDLYYVEAADHFAFKLSGQLFHGNIGSIYTEEKNPEKIKDCKFATSCMKQDNCDYYHDPIKFPGSKDRRNFIASSWLYAPPNSQYKNRPRSRRFGSREHLDTDIVGLQPEEVSRFNDQTIHDLLCSLLLNQSYTPSI